MIDELVGTPETYAADIRPKLEVLHQIAMINATDSATYHAQKYNSVASPPPFKVNDKVLLFTPVTKKYESSKLTRRFIGPYTITHCLSGFNYRLKAVETGKQVRRPVHAGRLRPFREPDDERLRYYRDPEYTGITPYRRIVCNVRVAHCISRAAGDDLLAECRTYIAQSGTLPIAQPLLTTSGKLRPRAQRVIHIVGPGIHESPFHDDPLLADATLEECYYNCLQAADAHGMQSLALPAISAGNYGMDRWSVAHAAAKAINRFDMETKHMPGTLQRIELINSSLVMSGIMSIVFKGLFQPPAQPPTVMDSPPAPSSATHVSNDLPSQSTTGWFEIDHIVRSARKKGKLKYLVKWRDYLKRLGWNVKT